MTMFLAKSAVIKKAVVVLYAAVCVLLVAVTFVSSLSPSYNVLYYFNEIQTSNQVQHSINGVEKGLLTLPTTLTNLKAGDEVSVFMESAGRDRDNLLLKVDHASCVLSIDGKSYFSVGSEGTYPTFQKEPPRFIEIVALPNVDAGTEVRLDFTVAPINDSLSLEAFHSGDQNLLAEEILADNCLALILSLMLLLLGVILAIIGLILFRRAEFAIVLFWLGVSCLASGCWTLFANDVVLLSFGQFSAFYTISLIALFSIPIPLGRLCIIYVQPFRSALLDGAFVAVCVLFAAMMLSHITGFVSLGQVAPYFQVIGSLLLALYVVVILVARKQNHETISPLFVAGIVIFAALSIFDSISTHVGIKSPTGTFFVIGLFIATLVIALLIWEYLSGVLDAEERNARLEADISAINHSLDLQRKHFEDFSQTAEETRRIRHDLRHQLVAIQGLIRERKDKEALEYIDTISRSIPSVSDMLICDNAAVNSLVVHYIAQAKAEHIFCDVRMVVPTVTGHIPDGDLSVVVGNLFENAIEACMHVEPDKRFIKIRSNVIGNRFNLIVDNSFDGQFQVSGTDFHSRKRRGHGVGIASVKSVVHKYKGSMLYEAESGVFKTSLYMRM